MRLEAIVRTLFSAAVLAVILLTAGSHDNAAAQAVVKPTSNIFIPSTQGADGREIFWALNFMSDNRSQGFTSSMEDPSVAGDIGILWNSFFIGASIESVDFGKVLGKNVADSGITTYAGIIKTFNSVNVDAVISYAHYPDAFDPFGELDYWEGSAGLSTPLFSDVKGGVRLYYTPEYSGETGNNFIIEASMQKPLPAMGKWSPVFTSLVGYQAGEESKGGFDYWFWEAGVEVALSQHHSIDFRYHDSADVPFSCSGLCGAAFVVTFRIEN